MCNILQSFGVCLEYIPHLKRDKYIDINSHLLTEKLFCWYPLFILPGTGKKD